MVKKQFSHQYISREVNYDHRGFTRLATDHEPGSHCIKHFSLKLQPLDHNLKIFLKLCEYLKSIIEILKSL